LPFSQLYHASNQQRRSIESCSQLHLGLKLVNYRLNLIMGGNSRDETSKPPGNESGETSSSGHRKFSVGEPAAEYAVQSADLIGELRRKRAEILCIAKRHGARNVRVFGSNDTKTQDAVLRNLQVLAESTQRLSNGLKARHSEVPWRTIAAFRNVLVHGYLGVNLERVWQILHEDLPPLWDRFLKFSKNVRLDEI
jgi:uncharacterized protein with HEPN domain